MLETLAVDGSRFCGITSIVKFLLYIIHSGCVFRCWLNSHALYIIQMREYDSKTLYVTSQTHNLTEASLKEIKCHGI